MRQNQGVFFLDENPKRSQAGGISRHEKNHCSKSLASRFGHESLCRLGLARFGGSTNLTNLWGSSISRARVCPQCLLQSQQQKAGCVSNEDWNPNMDFGVLCGFIFISGFLFGCLKGEPTGKHLDRCPTKQSCTGLEASRLCHQCQCAGR